MQDSNNSLTDSLRILGDAISDVGYWSWWASNLPDTFQIEFGGTQLLFGQPTHTSPPPTKVAIRFIEPKNIYFISRAEGKDNFVWASLLQADEMEPPTCSYGEFSFGRTELTNLIISKTKATKPLLAQNDLLSDIFNQRHCIAFWCGDIGMAIGSEEIRLFSNVGEIAPEEISLRNSDWWKYWRSYWDRKDTPHSFPDDYACEVIIPSPG